MNQICGAEGHTIFDFLVRKTEAYAMGDSEERANSDGIEGVLSLFSSTILFLFYTGIRLRSDSKKKGGKRKLLILVREAQTWPLPAETLARGAATGDAVARGLGPAAPGVWRCSPSYVTTSIAGSSVARSTCFLAGHPRTVLHL